MSRNWQVLALLAVAGIDVVAAQAPVDNERGVVERVARATNPSLRRDVARLGEIERELSGLPDLLPEPFASRYGFRSQSLTDPDEPHWLQIDLGHRETLDRIVAVPVHIPALGEQGVGFGFPLRFKIEVADDPKMVGAVTVVDRTNGDFPNPGKFPVDIEIEPVTGRYIRFTATRHARTGE